MDNAELAEKLLKEADAKGCRVPIERIVKAYNKACETMDARKILNVLTCTFAAGFIQALEIRKQEEALIREAERAANGNKSEG